MQKFKKYLKNPIFWVDIVLFIIIIGLIIFIVIKSRTPMLIDDYTIHNATNAEEGSTANFFEEKSNNKTLQEWQEINSEVVYLLKINNKEFPVLHNSSKDYYLDHDVFNNYDIFGSIFLEPSTANINTNNKIIYGHSTYNKDLMFTFIANYKDENYYEDNKTFVLETPNGEYTYIVLALMEIEDSQNPNNMMWFTPDMGEVNALEFAKNFINDADYVYSNIVAPSKPFIELVTCKMGTNVEDSIGRYVLLAQQVN